MVKSKEEYTKNHLYIFSPFLYGHCHYFDNDCFYLSGIDHVFCNNSKHRLTEGFGNLPSTFLNLELIFIKKILLLISGQIELCRNKQNGKIWLKTTLQITNV